ncbi:glycosyltransferase family 2 protein [Algoriphagus mannitolivorans]|uniref:glycosyltransferase family 2 protein n=1 Tax=Algoriphagus mannitolivorans TaxID=226504 RepID=UPI000417532E|nr:glycosyltransferase family A protein [Algoriphagus mannitolivorans]
MKQPLVSVCIPTFQHKSFIEQCLDSVLAQNTNFDFEIILGEDDSTDGTRVICQEYAAKYPDKIRIFLRKDQDKIPLLGRKSGRINYLENFRAAQGKYIAMLDGDDCWVRLDKLQKQVEMLEKNPEAFLCSSEFLDGPRLNQKLSSSETPDEEFTFYPKAALTKVSYLGHVSNWVFRNNLSEFLTSNAALKGPILDLLLFSFFKKKGGIIHWSAPSSFYRTNEKSYHVNKLSKSRHRELLWSSWYQFRDIHRNPIQFIRFLGYLGKKILRKKS